MKTYYIVLDEVAHEPYLAWEIDGIMYADSCFGDWAIDRAILAKKKVFFPTRYTRNGWKLYLEELPRYNEDDLYSPSEVVLTFESCTNTVNESHWYPIDMKWIDAESAGSYTDYHPDYWVYLPTVAEMKAYLK